MGIWIFIENLRLYGSIEQLKMEAIDIEVSESIQVDYVRTFIDAELFQEMDSEISGLFSRALQLVEDLEQKGGNSTHLRTEYAKAHDVWRKDRYLYYEAKGFLDPIIKSLEHFDEISELFTNASQHIEKAVQAEMDPGAMERDYGYAEKSWVEFDYGVTKWYLDRILDIQIPEPVLLPIFGLLGLILLPALIQRRG
jgi:hypothetical protein